MDDGTKKAGGVLASVLVAVGAFVAHGADDCARIGARSPVSLGDDVARTGPADHSAVGTSPTSSRWRPTPTMSALR